MTSSQNSGNEPTPNKLHAIQLIAVQVTALSIQVHADPSELKNCEGILQLESTHSPYDEEKKSLEVRVRAIISEESESPLSLEVEIVGVFKVDEDRFPKPYINDWAKTNAPLVLYPFVREQIYSLSVRVGATGLMVPLIEIPTFRVVAPQVES